MEKRINIAIPKDLHKELVKYYNKQDKLKYPSLMNFVSQKLREIIVGGG